MKKCLPNVVFSVWLLCFMTLAHAASFSADVYAFDWESLVLAAGAGLLGGAARTILTLASDKIVVVDALREFGKDALIALVGGGVAYLLIVAVTSKYPDLITREIRMLIITGFGFSRGRWTGWLDEATNEGLAKLRRRLTGDKPDEPLPPPAAAPIEEIVK